MLILASKSPRREEILRNAGYDFKTIPSNADESIPTNATPSEAAVLIAKNKALGISEKYPDDVVIGADTIVVLDGIIMGKPKDKDDAFRMLRSLSGKIHEVITGVCVLCGKRCDVFFESTMVEFYPLSDFEIEDYVSTGEPFDKAGAYVLHE